MAWSRQFFHIKTIKIIKHKNIDKIICTSFENINECIFICAVFKNAIDCIIIEIPLNEINPEHSEIDKGFIDWEIVLQPRVTSKIPKTIPSQVEKSIFNIGFNTEYKLCESKGTIFNEIKISVIK